MITTLHIMRDFRFCVVLGAILNICSCNKVSLPFKYQNVCLEQYETFQVEYVGENNNAHFYSSDELVCSVTYDGLITARNAGTTFVNVSVAGKVAGKCEVSVVANADMNVDISSSIFWYIHNLGAYPMGSLGCKYSDIPVIEDELLGRVPSVADYEELLNHRRFHWSLSMSKHNPGYVVRGMNGLSIFLPIDTDSDDTFYASADDGTFLRLSKTDYGLYYGEVPGFYVRTVGDKIIPWPDPTDL